MKKDEMCDPVLGRVSFEVVLWKWRIPTACGTLACLLAFGLPVNSLADKKDEAAGTQQVREEYDQVQELEKALKEKKQEIAAAKARIQKKFAPSPLDSASVLWGKMLRFRSVNLADDAIRCLDQYAVIASNDAVELQGSRAVPAAKVFVRQSTLLKVDGGIIVIGFEPPATSHAVICVGDIVLSCQGKPCRKIEDCSTKGGKRLTLLRLNQDKETFEKLTITIPSGQPRVAFRELTEML